ncbi:hypothetical protein SAY86_021498 [Trapa natans]|uniref:Uncharacterized protein n=1 Tax=Trapa natans TaxID=22666 RepID=A0AAN7MC61_TRANT|nr:hypothetical protein SAY86_021498 [Trapa natans]
MRGSKLDAEIDLESGTIHIEPKHPQCGPRAFSEELVLVSIMESGSRATRRFDEQTDLYSSV